MNKVNEALDLDRTNVRSVRGKARKFSQIYADYQEEANGGLTFLGYSVKSAWTDFTAEVNKTANRSIDFCHFYRVRRECIAAGVPGPAVGHTATDHVSMSEYLFLTPYNEISDKEKEEYNLEEPKGGYFIDLKKIGASGHIECPYVTYREFTSEYVSEIYKQEQQILKQITETELYKGTRDNYTSDKEKAIDADSIRGRTTTFSGEDSDWNMVDLVTEVELSLVYMFDTLDNTKIDDATKLDLVRFAASVVAEKRLGKSSVLGHRTSPKGASLARRDVKGNVAQGLIDDMVNYVDGNSYVGTEVDKDEVEYFKDLGDLRKTIKSISDESEYQIEGDGDVKPRIRTAKKRGDGYTAFKTMPSKYKSEHSSDIDDSDW